MNPTPSKDIATITMPEIAPPLKATRKASFRLFLAALAVLMLALIETHMLKMPATAELAAPNKNATDVRHPRSNFPIKA